MKKINRTIKLVIMLSLVFLIGFSLLGCRHVIKKEQQVVIGTVINKYSPAYSKCPLDDDNKCIFVSYNNKNYKFYENAKNTCDFSREMNWHDYFTKMIAF